MVPLPEEPLPLDDDPPPQEEPLPEEPLPLPDDPPQEEPLPEEPLPDEPPDEETEDHALEVEAQLPAVVYAASVLLDDVQTAVVVGEAISLVLVAYVG